MDLTSNDTQTYLREALSGALARDASMESVRQWVAEGDLSPAHALAVRQGWTGIGLSEEAGGQGGGVQELSVVAEEMGRRAVPWDQLLATCLAGPVAAAADQRGIELARRGAEGDALSVLCVDARVPLVSSSMVTQAGETISGAVSYVMGASSADVLLVFAATGREDEVRLLEVDQDASGLQLDPRRLVDGTRSLADVRFDRTPARELGVLPSSDVDRALEIGTVLNNADMLGSAARMLEMTVDYVKERHQFGVPVGSFQAVKHAAAQMLVDVEGMRSAVQFSAWASDERVDDATVHIAVAGAYCSSAATAVADRALFLHGAIGYTWEHDLHLLFKRAKSGAELFGSADTHREAIASALTDPAD